LLGVYETSSDVQTLLAHETENVRAAKAVGLFCYQVRNLIGIFATVPGKLRQYYSSGNLKSKGPGWPVHRHESNWAMVVETDDIILVWNNPWNIETIVNLYRATFRKMIPQLLRATGCNTFVIHLATDVLYAYGVLFTSAIGMTLIAASAVIMAIDMSFLEIKRLQYDKGKD
jgi:hypothetical protein